MNLANNKYYKGLRKKASPKDTGFCPICGEEVISKCGDIKIWHWAHKKGIECDSFGEPETKWHLEWKDNFPKECQEVKITKKEESKYFGKDEIKIHRADIQTKENLIIEFQNSPISSEKIQEREEFYGNMVWILNGETLGKNVTFFIRKFKWAWQPKSWDYAYKDIYLDYGLNFIWKIDLSNMTFEKLSRDAFIIHNGGNP